MQQPHIGILGIGTYFPETIEVAADLVDATQIPEHILREKMGIRQRHIAGEQDTVSYMASQAAKQAIQRADIDPSEIDMVISHGSEYKDHVVWNAAGKIQHEVGAINAYGFEMYALCAGAPIAMNIARSMMLADPALNTVLLAAGSRENDLISPSNPRARFMYNFGAGGGAMLLRRGFEQNIILGASAFTDGSLSETVMLTRAADALGDDDAIKGDYHGNLDVQNSDYMAERLGATSLDNFVKVITESVEKSGYTLDDVAFMGITHMKRSFYELILEQVGLTPEQSVYLEDYGHIQSVDQVITLELGLAQGKIKAGDVVVLTGAGTGYTWSAITLRWG
ncbi:MAG: 3-oxoacyl-ACP synthase [Phototrophicaceae bacterium]